MMRSYPRSIFLTLLLLAAGATQGQNLPREKLFPPWPALWSSYNTHPRDCHQGRVDAQGRLILTGVETIGDPRSMAARQQIVLMVNAQGLWSDPIELSPQGIVYFPALAVAEDGTVWVAWSQFIQGRWETMVRSWRDGQLSETVKLSGMAAINLQPAILVLGSGEVLAAWQAASAPGRFSIHGRSLAGGAWSAEQALSSGGDHEFRAAFAVDSRGAPWLVWDRATGSRYSVHAKYRAADGWSQELTPFASPARAAQVRADASGRVWILATGQLAGLDQGGNRYELEGPLPTWDGGPDSFAIGPRGAFWFFKALTTFRNFPWMAAWQTATTAVARLDTGGLHELPVQQAALGYAPPSVDAEGNLWMMNREQFLRFRQPFESGGGAPSSKAAPLAVAAASPAEPARSWPHDQLVVNRAKIGIYWAEMHNHLLEEPGDRQMAEWIDRFYLTSRHRDGLDAAALTDHDWPGMTRSMYYLEQGYASVFTLPGRFVAFSGFEWSGDAQTRARYGDRTVLFPAGFFDIPRITDPRANTARKLSGYLKGIGALGWPHHIGRAESPVDPKELIPETEPVIEMTSNHGVFETYDPEHAVPVPFRTQIVPGTSAQDALAAGKRVGLVGSSDSHNGFSGYRTGMLAVAATQLTRQAIMDAIRRRRTWAVRGGDPIVVEVRANGHYIGAEFTATQPVRLEIKARGTYAITRIDVIRNNRYVLSQPYSDAVAERLLTFEDPEPPPAYYYVRVHQAGGGYAWTSPIWADPPATVTGAAAFSWLGLGGLLAVAVLAIPRRRRPAR